MTTVRLVKTDHMAGPAVLVLTWLLAELDQSTVVGTRFSDTSISLEIQPPSAAFRASAVVGDVMREDRFDGWSVVTTAASLIAV